MKNPKELTNEELQVKKAEINRNIKKYIDEISPKNKDIDTLICCLRRIEQCEQAQATLKNISKCENILFLGYNEELITDDFNLNRLKNNLSFHKLGSMCIDFSEIPNTEEIIANINTHLIVQINKELGEI